MWNRVYLDHAGATLPSRVQMEEIASNLVADSLNYGNPHSRHQSGQNSAAMMKQTREKILAFFGVTSDEYHVVFTKNASDALRIVVESLDQLFQNQDPSKKRKLVLLQDSHTSVHGSKARFHNFDFELIQSNDENFPSTKADVFLFTAMKHNPSLITVVDIAALCGTSSVNLRNFHFPEFAVLSFYKIFGYPTGIGGLLIKKTKFFEDHLCPVGFAGGNVSKYNVKTGEFVFKQEVEERFESGTPNYHGISLLKYGFKDIEKFGGMPTIQKDTFQLAFDVFKFLSTTTHSNGAPVAKVYGWASPESSNQGPIVNFNLLRDDGTYVGYVEVEKMSELFNIELRTGCFCNQGACDAYLGFHEQQNHHPTDLDSKKCGDEFDLLDGKPLGSCRISFGRTSTMEDVQVFKHMIETCFISTRKLLEKYGVEAHSSIKRNFATLTHVFFYPVKSCAPASPRKWRLTKSGLWLDRQWMAVTSDGVVLTQKKLPVLCSVIPEVTENNTLTISSRFGGEQVEVPLDGSPGSKIQTTVCIKNVTAVDCGDACSIWFGNLHPTVPQGTRLIRQLDVNCNKDQSTTFNNVADYLLITWNSIRAIAKAVNLPVEVVMPRFRANFVIETGDDVPFDEDTYRKIWIAGVGFEVTAKCTRCQMIAIDQETGEKDPNVMLALRDLRCGDKITFGVYLRRMTNYPVDISIGSTVKIDR